MNFPNDIIHNLEVQQYNYTATIQGYTPYGRGLYTLFTGNLPAEIKKWDDIIHQYLWQSIIILWVGIRATERGAKYIVKVEGGENISGISYFRISEKVSLKKYLKLKKEIN